MDIKYFSLTFSLVGLIILYLLSLISQPPLIQLQTISQYEGKQVTIEGIVVDYYTTQQESQIIKIKENLTTNSSINPVILFVSQNKTVQYGDKLQATGTVQRYNENWEVIVDDRSAITIINRWKNRSFPLWQVAENPERFCGLNVNVTGNLKSVYSTYFYLSDIQKNYNLVVRTKSDLTENISSGHYVAVAGKFCYDDSTLQYYLGLMEENHGIWVLER